MRRFSPSILLSLSLLFSSSAALAQGVRETDDRVEMVFGNDLYTAGNAINVDGTIEDDLFAAGNSVTLTGIVNGDLHAAGSNVSINGTVNDDVRTAGSTVTINGNVNGDIIMFGGSVIIAENATISGSIIAAGGNIVIDGTVRGNVKADGVKISINGNIGGNTELRSESITLGGTIRGNAIIISNTITTTEGGRIGGDLRYWQENREANLDGAVDGNITYDEQLKREQAAGIDEDTAIGGIIGAITLFTIFYAALTIGLFMLATKTLFVESAKRLNADPWWSLLIGFLYFAVTPFIIALLMVTLIGIPLGLALLAIYLMSVFFSKIIAAIIITRWFEMKNKKKWHPAGIYFASIGVYLVLKLVGLIPILGWILVFLTVVAAYGAFATIKYERLRKIR